MRKTIDVSRLGLVAGLGLVLGAIGAAGQASAEASCATPDQRQQIQNFYAENPGTLPTIAARRLKLPEELVASGLPADQAASAPGEAFAEVWALMSRWEQANFLIMKGANVFEILSPVAPGAPSTRSDYYNIEYTHPLRGHLRPDLYTSIYAVAIPAKEETIRGVLFYDPDGESVFGAFISGEALTPPASELAKFDAVMALIRSKPPVCN